LRHEVAYLIVQRRSDEAGWTQCSGTAILWEHACLVHPERVWSLPDNAPKHPSGCGENAVRQKLSWKPCPG